MKQGKLILLLMVVACLAVIMVDFMVVSAFKKTFKKLETQRIVTANKLTTVKIVSENLNHVRDLVFKNMDFTGQKDTVSHETHVFDFLTECINDLKLTIMAMRPLRPETKGRITTYSYEIELEGDFFQFGEFCSKLENSRRIFSVEAFQLKLVDASEGSTGGPENKKIKVTMLINTYRVKKS
jgi:Tfp pilus assembly protein PilO